MKPGQPHTRRVIKTADEQAWDAWVRRQLNLGITPLALTAQLVKKGWQWYQANRLVESHRDAYKPVPTAPVESPVPDFEPPGDGSSQWWVLVILLTIIALAALVWIIAISGRS